MIISISIIIIVVVSSPEKEKRERMRNEVVMTVVSTSVFLIDYLSHSRRTKNDSKCVCMCRYVFTQVEGKTSKEKEPLKRSLLLFVCVDVV